MFIAGESLIDTVFKTLEDLDWSFRQHFETDEKQVLLTLELPGKKPEDIEVNVENKILTIGLKGKELRRYRLADSIDQDGISAKTEHGVLTVTLPRKQEAKPAARKITVT